MITSYSQMPVGIYLNILTVLHRDHIPDIDRQVSVLSYLCDEDKSTILHLPLPEFQRRCEACAFLAKEVPPRHGPMPRALYLGGGEYRIDADPETITAAQFVDFQHFAERWPDAETRPLVELLSCLIVPKGKTYGEGYSMKELQQTIRAELDTVTALALAAFFFRSSVQSVTAILNFSDRAIKETLPEGTQKRERLDLMLDGYRTILRENGDGSIMYALLRLPPIYRGVMFGDSQPSSSSTSAPTSTTGTKSESDRHASGVPNTDGDD